MTRQTISVDIVPGKGRIKRLSVTQGDIGRPLGVYLTRNETPLDCSQYTVELYIEKPDGSKSIYPITCDETETNLAKWETTAGETSMAGECNAQIRISRDSINIGTADFVELIEESFRELNEGG